jgi:hypothetical protein
MGYGIMAYAIDSDEIRKAVGSRSQEALEAYQADFANDAAEIDELVGDFEGEPVPTAQEALRQLVMGEPMDDRVGFVYAYCLKHLCNAHGEFLDNGAWYPAGYPHLERVQEALDVAGVPRETIAISQLTAGESPIPIPVVDDFPGIGFLARPAVRAAFDALARVNTAAIGDDDVRESLVALKGWLQTCRDQNRDLICFYH